MLLLDAVVKGFHETVVDDTLYFLAEIDWFIVYVVQQIHSKTSEYGSNYCNYKLAQ